MSFWPCCWIGACTTEASPSRRIPAVAAQFGKTHASRPNGRVSYCWPIPSSPAHSFAEAVFGKPMTYTHKTVFGILSWLIYRGLLLKHYMTAWRGKKAAVWTIIGVVSLMIAYMSNNFVTEIIRQTQEQNQYETVFGIYCRLIYGLLLKTAWPHGAVKPPWPSSDFVSLMIASYKQRSYWKSFWKDKKTTDAAWVLEFQTAYSQRRTSRRGRWRIAGGAGSCLQKKPYPTATWRISQKIPLKALTVFPVGV